LSRQSRRERSPSDRTGRAARSPPCGRVELSVAPILEPRDPQGDASSCEQGVCRGGEKITVLASNAVTHGYEIFLQQGVEGSGPPPHGHDWDEAFYVVKGQVEIHYGDKTVLAEPGTVVHLPAGTVHSFRFGAGGGEMISVTDARSRASQLFTNIDKEIAPGPPDVPKLIAVAHQNGVKVAV
jgi:quercetin dioxygenase-like cupin family protein